MAKKSADKLVNLYHLPDEFKRELYDVNHFNEYIIAERLVNYASHRGLKGNKIPIISFDSIVPFILDLRKLTKQDEEKAKELMSPEDIKKFTPRIWTAGSRFKDIKTLVNYVADAKRKDEAFLSGAKVEPTEVEEEKYKFNVVFTDIISEVKSSMNASPSLNSLSIDDLRNLAVANKLSQHKDYISPNSVQEMLEDEQVNINVTQELEDEK